MLERDFQASLVRKIKAMLPGCIVSKNDCTQKQGIPDLLILYNKKWAALECKRKKPAKSDFRANQEYYIDLLNKMSFCRVIYPENEKEVLDDLQQALRPRRTTRVSGSK